MELLIAPLLLSTVFASPDSKAGKFPKAKAAKSYGYGNMCMSTSSMSMSVGPEPPITPSPTPAPTTSGVFLSAKGANGGVSFGEEFNSLKVDGSTAQAIIRGGSLDASSSDDNGLVVRNDGSAYICKADLIKGGACISSSSIPCLTGDGLPAVQLSDQQATAPNPNIYVVNARIEGGNAGDEGAFEGKGLVVNSGQADIVSKKSTIVGGLNGDNTSRGVAIEVGNSGNLYVYEGHIGDAITGRSLNNFGSAYIYGGKWMGKWTVAGPTNVYGTNLELDVSNLLLTGTLCDGNEIDVQIIPQGGDLTLFQEQDSCSQYEDVTNTLPYSECE